MQSDMHSSPIKPNLEQLKKTLSRYFSNEDRVIVAYLFGSTVRGEANCLSDVDIAVLFDDILTKKEAFDLQLKLIGDLGSLLKTNDIDLVMLNNASLVLAFNIIRDGVILKSDEKKRVHFETRVMSRYLDEHYHIKRHARESLRKIAKNGFR
jgi:predicted nucleotidyltransferase